MSFWGQIVKPGVPAKLKSNGAFTTVLKQAALASDAKGKEASVLSVSVGSADKFVLCHLSPGKVEQWTIDLGFNAEDEVSFHLSGSAPVHLTGFYEDEDDQEDFDDEDIDDDDDLDDGEDDLDDEREGREEDAEDERDDEPAPQLPPLPMSGKADAAPSLLLRPAEAVAR